MPLIIFLLFGGFLIFALPARVVGGENIVTNSSFEDGAGSGIPNDWGYFLPAVPDDNPFGLTKGDVGLFAVDASVAKTGTHSLRISSSVPVRCSVVQKVPFVVGQKLKLSAWIKGEGLDIGPQQGAWVRLGLVNSDPDKAKALFPSTGFLKATEQTFDWTYFSTEITVPEGVEMMPLECFLWQSKGTVWFDDISVEVVSGPETPASALNDPADKARYRQENAQLSARTANEQPVIFIGDSITDNLKLNTYFPQETFINRGIGEQNTSQIAERFAVDALALKAESYLALGRGQ